MKFKDIPQFTRSASYHVNIDWNYLNEWIKKEQSTIENIAVLNLNPDFQRGHVWTVEQQRRYVEFVLRGGKSSKTLYFNCTGWNDDYRGPYELIDGKQRLTAVLKFLNNELTIFIGNYFKDFTDKLRLLQATFVIEINDLATRAEVLQWYLDLNTGGVVHSKKEIDKVKELLETELDNECFKRF